MPYTVGSLFSGIGGLEIGLERVGLVVKWQVERDPYCLGVLKKHWPEVPKYTDVCSLDATKIEKVDVLCGGFPCQPVSNAGKQHVENDERWLWPEFYRIIQQQTPRIVLIENVQALRGKGLHFVLTDLARAGYDAEWDCIPASRFGAPHRRNRIFIVAYPHSGLMEDGHRVCKVLGKKEWKARVGEFGGISGAKAWREAITQFCRDDDGLPSGVVRASALKHRRFRIKAVGNAVVPVVAEWLGEQIVHYLSSMAALEY